MSTQTIEKEEYLESLWEMKEKNIDTLDELAERHKGSFKLSVVKELALESLVEYNEEKKRTPSTAAKISNQTLLIKGQSNYL